MEKLFKIEDVIKNICEELHIEDYSSCFDDYFKTLDVSNSHRYFHIFCDVDSDPQLYYCQHRTGHGNEGEIYCAFNSVIHFVMNFFSEDKAKDELNKILNKHSIF